MSPSTDAGDSPTGTVAVGVLWIGALAVVVASCAWSQRPDPDNSVVPSIAVGDSLEPDSRLFPTRDGRWARVDRREERENRRENDDPVGELLSVNLPTDRGTSSRHVFVRTASHDWGSYLQRLDARTIQRPTGPAEFESIGAASAGERTASGACRGDGRPSLEGPCFKEAEEAAPGARWLLYPADESGRLREPTESTALSLPYAPSAVVHRVDDTLEFLDGAESLPSTWWAIRSSGEEGGLAGTRTVVAVDDDCPKGITGLDELGSTVTLRRSLVDGDHPLVVANAAYTHGADALVRCRDDRLDIAVPALFRSWLRTPSGTLLGPSSTGRSSVDLPRSMEATLRGHAIRGLARVAVGAPLLAYLDLQRLFRHDDARQFGDLPTRAMGVAVAAGFAESGLRWGATVARGDWNRESNPDFLLGRAAVRAGLGRREGSVIDVRAARKAAEQGQNERLRRWLDWSAFATQSGATGPSPEKATERAEEYRRDGLPRWALMFRWVAARQNPSFEPDSPPDVDGVDALAAGLARREVQLDCPDQSCPLDVYGRRLESRFEQARKRGDWTTLAEDLRRLGSASFRPGFDRLPSPDTLPEDDTRLDVAVALARHFDTWPSPASHRWVESTVAWALRSPERCGEVDDAPSLSASPARAGDEPSRLELMAWLVDHLESSTCGEPGGAAESLAEWVEENDGSASLAAPLFDALFDQSESAASRTTIAREAAESLRGTEVGSACYRWHLALADAHAAAGDHDGAEAWLESAVNCTDTDADALERTADMLGAFVAFQRSGRLPRRLGPELGPAARRLVRRETAPNTCAGLAEFGYRLDSEVAAPVRRLADRLDVSAPETEDGSLTLASASDQLDAARSRLDEARNSLAAGDLATGAEKLASTSRSFGRIDHLPGRTLTAFLGTALFDSAPDSYEQPPEDELDCTPEDSDSEALRETMGTPRGRRCLLRRADIETVLSTLDVPDSDWNTATRRGWVALRLLRGDLESAQRANERHIERASNSGGPFSDLCGAGPKWRERHTQRSARGSDGGRQLFTSSRSTP